MPYQVNGNDGFTPRRRKLPFFRIRPLFIHIAFIIILVIVLILFFSSDSSKNSDELYHNEITLIGELTEFNITYSGDLEIDMSEFTLETSTAKIGEKAKEFNIRNFTGNIFYSNKSIILNGTAKNITYDQNIINLNHEKFELVGEKKTSLSMDFDNITFNFEKGRVKFSNTLNYELDNSTINIKNFSSDITFDGTFSISGKLEEFEINTPKQGLNLQYSLKKEKENREENNKEEKDKENNE